MINSRWIAVNADAVAISPPFGRWANAVTARSISPASRTSTGLSSTCNDGATAWMAANWPIPTATGSRRTAARITRGAISLSNSSHFPLRPYSDNVKPVVLPPGCAKLATRPPPTGSVTFVNTIGTVRVARCNASTAGAQSRRYFEAGRLRSLEVDPQLVLSRRLHRQIGGPLALENAVDVAGRPTVLVDVKRIRPVGHQAAASNEKPGGVDRGQPVLGR